MKPVWICGAWTKEPGYPVLLQVERLGCFDPWCVCGRTSAWGSATSPSPSLTGPTAICFSASVFLFQWRNNWCKCIFPVPFLHHSWTVTRQEVKVIISNAAAAPSAGRAAAVQPAGASLTHLMKMILTFEMEFLMMADAFWWLWPYRICPFI